MKNREKIAANLKQPAKNQGTRNAPQKPVEREVASLMGELQLAQLELEMQNDELNVSAQMLETERTKFTDFFNLAPTGYFILDQKGRVIDANQVGLTLLSVEKPALLQKQLHGFITPAEVEKFELFLQSMKPGSIRVETEIKLQRPNNSECYVKIEGMAVLGAVNKEMTYYVTIIDITPTKLAQQRLRVTTERLGMALKASGTGTWSIDLAENKVFLDEFSLALLELEPAEFDNSLAHFLGLVHPDDHLIVQRHLLEELGQEDKIDVEFRIFTKNKKIKYLATKGHHIQTELGKRFSIGIILDVTDRKKIALAKQELQDEKQKLILATTFKAQENERYKISSALHDSICQLLYGIRFNLQHIHLNGDISEELKVVNQLLNQAIKETRELSYELTPSVLRDFGFVEGIKEMAQRLSSKSFRISTKLKDDSNHLSKELQLTVFRIIQELLNNCIKHAQANKAEIIVCTEHDLVTIIVSDNGKGFDEDVETLMAKGSGLRGIRNRVLLLEGNLDFQSSAKGSKVTISFKKEGAS